MTAVSRVKALDEESDVVRIDREAREATLDFLDRVGGKRRVLGTLSLFVPSGFVAKETRQGPEKSSRRSITGAAVRDA